MSPADGSDEAAQPTAGEPQDGADSPAVSYADALDELDTILAELENDRVDVDVLADRVKRAAYLIALCRSRIDTARMEVDRIVASLETDESRP